MVSQMTDSINQSSENFADEQIALPCPGAADQGALEAFLSDREIAFTTHEHAPVFTVAEAQALRGVLPGVHCKCLFLKSKKGALVLAVVREELQVDLKWLSGELGLGRFSFGKPDLLAEVLGVRPGAVTPFSLINDKPRTVLPVLDEEMLAGELVNYHPLRNDRTTALTPNALLAFIEACGHTPRVMRFSSV